MVHILSEWLDPCYPSLLKLTPDPLVNAIIFLAPMSCFDESLIEDSNINRLVCASVCLQSSS